MSDTNSKSSTSTSTTSTPPGKLDKPEFLLALVVTFMLWSIGFVDLLTHISGSPEEAIFGLYSRSVFVLLIGYSALFFVWLGLLLWPGSHRWVPAQIGRIQANPWLAAGLLLLIGALLWSLLSQYRWSDFPGLRAALFFFSLLISGILVLSNWPASKGPRLWQKLFLYPAILFLLLEIAVQGVAFAGILPGNININTGLFSPYGRIYQNVEGFANATTNNYGWYYPDFRLKRDEQRIILLGDSTIQALQIQPEEHMGVALEGALNSWLSDQEEPQMQTEVLAMGMPGFGPGLYLSDTRLTDTIKIFQPKEIILFFHLANDFQTGDGPESYQLYHNIDGNGTVTIADESWQDRHNLQHYILHGYEYDVDLVKTIKSHILLLKVFGQLSNAPSFATTPIDPMHIAQAKGIVLQEVPLPGDFNDIRRTAVIPDAGAANLLFDNVIDANEDHAFAVATGLIKATQEQLREADVTLRIVTIPAFPPAFFAPNRPDGPLNQIGGLDLLHPEMQLQKFAADQGIPFLATGEVLMRDGQSLEQIQSYFYRHGISHLTPAGHVFMGELIAECFYGVQLDFGGWLGDSGCYAE